MPLTVFDTKGIPAHRRERIEAAVTAGGKHVRELYYRCPPLIDRPGNILNA
jgi:hypothetical protein